MIPMWYSRSRYRTRKARVEKLSLRSAADDAAATAVRSPHAEHHGAGFVRQATAGNTSVSGGSMRRGTLPSSIRCSRSGSRGFRRSYGWGQLSSSTSVYRPFELVYWVHVSDRDQAEGYAHQPLHQYRVNPAREFFQASVMDVARALDQAAAYFPIPLGRTARSGFLGPGLTPITVRCSSCGAANRAPRLLVPIRLSCGTCAHMLTIKAPATRG